MPLVYQKSVCKKKFSIVVDRMEYRGTSPKPLSVLSDVFHGLLNEQTRGMIVRREQIFGQYQK